MQVYHDIEEIQPIDYAVVTSGTFDGVHIGHQKILERLKEVALRHRGKSVLITYWPHPRLVLQANSSDLKLLNTFEEKLDLLEEQGIDYLIKVPFTKEFSLWSSEHFIRHILINKIKTKKLVIGYDHRFGKNREGSFEHLTSNAEKYGFEVEEIPRQDIDEIGISSTKIRKALLSGDVELGNEYLGRAFGLTATVVEGNKIGRKIGFPTANLVVQDRHKLIPADGVYAVNVMFGGRRYGGMLNIGFRPSVAGDTRVMEVHIFDFDMMIYNEVLTVKFLRRIREEIKFDSLEALKAQLSKDKAMAIRLMGI